MIGPLSVPDAGAFLARLLRLDDAALVRLRPAGGDAVAMWARLPFEVLVTRNVSAALAEDVTVRAADLLGALERGDAALPTRHDAAWRWQLPPPGNPPVMDSVPAGELRRVAAAAQETVRAAAGRRVGERALRDALLDHVAVTIDNGPDRVDVPVRVVQALVRMGFLGTDEVAFGRVGAWLGAEATFGTAWYRLITHPFGPPHAAPTGRIS